MKDAKASPLNANGAVHQALVDMFPRLQAAGFATARRVSINIEHALGILSTHFERNKTEAWRGQTSWVITKLKDDSLDGVTTLFSGEMYNAARHSEQRIAILGLARNAKGALYSTALPLGGAIALQNGPLHLLKAKCLEIQKDLKELMGQTQTQAESFNDTDPYRRSSRARARQTSTPELTGL